ncbi:CAP domain-containing protein, partial [Xanthovirga aplysinae]|uniref:CAP domain-containing protein n=1 Tax=Xanthovirga aplysinae TaxID=2529853 RepID=UPI0012BCCD06
GSDDGSDDGSGGTFTAVELEIHDLVNEHRKSLGKEALTLNTIIYEEAKAHTEYMVAVGQMSHDNFDDRANRLMNQVGGNAIAENVAKFYSTPEQVVNGWLNSPGHKKNIEGDYNLTGIAAIKDGSGRYYYTQIFLRK